jgi:hypothetical protein
VTEPASRAEAILEAALVAAIAMGLAFLAGSGVSPSFLVRLLP